MFSLNKIKASANQANQICCTHNMEYMNIINYLKRQKIPEHVKMLTSKWYRKEENFFPYHFRSLKCIQFVKNNFFVTNNGEKGGGGWLGGGRVGWILDFPPSGAQGRFDWTKLAHAQLDHVSYKIRR